MRTPRIMAEDHGLTMLGESFVEAASASNRYGRSGRPCPSAALPAPAGLRLPCRRPPRSVARGMRAKEIDCAGPGLSSLCFAAPASQQLAPVSPQLAPGWRSPPPARPAGLPPADPKSDHRPGCQRRSPTSAMRDCIALADAALQARRSASRSSRSRLAASRPRCARARLVAPSPPLPSAADDEPRCIRRSRSSTSSRLDSSSSSPSASRFPAAAEGPGSCCPNASGARPPEPARASRESLGWR